MTSTFDPETAENHPDIEKQWAVKSFHHAETYFKLVNAVPPRQLKLTSIDEEIHAAFRFEFPDLNVGELREMEDFKTEAAKAKWRNFINQYQNKVEDFNFGTLLRNRCGEDYGPNNAFFVTRFQFYCIEIARNREGYNDVLHQKK
ncbi:putative polysaccharide biosynthesis protein [Entophlyctis helioformis]|nr:putative polysaccharide biosynthesis protein [Entophlyctis helioformis]